MSLNATAAGLGTRRGFPLLPDGALPLSEPIEAALAACVERWQTYHANPIDREVTPLDDMYIERTESWGWDHYHAIGLSALRLATEAMVITGRTNPRNILDLPCGGGRVTRHLVRFFPEATIHVSDIDAAKVEAVVAQFGVRSVQASRDFTAPLPGSYDLIFVGSLLTHFDKSLAIRTVDVLLNALEPGGVLILTTAGRKPAAEFRASEQKNGRVPGGWWSPALSLLTGGRVRGSRLLTTIDRTYARDGFAYLEIGGWTKLYGQSYGAAFITPAWLMRLVERRTDTMVIGFKERGYGDLLDAAMLQKCA